MTPFAKSERLGAHAEFDTCIDGTNTLLDVVNGLCLLYLINLNSGPSSKMKLQLLSSMSTTIPQFSSLSQSLKQHMRTFMHCIKKFGQFFSAQLSWKGVWALYGVIDLSTVSAFN